MSALELGAYGWVTKPFDASQVLIAVANAVIRAGLEEQSAANESQLEHAVAERTAALEETVAKLERSEERLRYLADHDQLTQLFNRRRFEEELNRELTRAKRYGSQGAVLSLDIDNFKAVNDSAGQAAGDAVLLKVASVLSERTRSSDFVARMGGDEFCALLPGVDAEQARTAAEDILAAIHDCVVVDEKPFRIAARIGIAECGSEDARASEVLVDADLAMYDAKRGGRDRIVVYTPAQARTARAAAKLTWSQRIGDALERDGFALHLQPILDLVTGGITHGELLLRMVDEDGTLIAPGAFLPAAERFGFVHAIDHWVVKQAVHLIRSSSNGPKLPVSVNLSGKSIVGDPELLPLIKRELARASADASSLIFEVTETVAIANMSEAQTFAAGLSGMGCRLALDDFGTGFGSFYYLKHLPVDYVKMDGEFIQNLSHSHVDEHMVRAIVEVAHGLDIKTVAESVPDDETIRLLQKHEVDYAQGFHVGEPVPIAAAA